ncbi:MAG TPA: hypothetical protein VK943_00690, partial [Arenibaculum sp.]|nr:hypothetical protein [Arenibaculum sp.]
AMEPMTNLTVVKAVNDLGDAPGIGERLNDMGEIEPTLSQACLALGVVPLEIHRARPGHWPGRSMADMTGPARRPMLR